MIPFIIRELVRKGWESSGKNDTSFLLTLGAKRSLQKNFLKGDWSSAPCDKTSEFCDKTSEFCDKVSQSSHVNVG